jgi:hypothetical protein
MDVEGLNVSDYIHPSYLSVTFKRAYSKIIPPVQLRRVGEGETHVACLAPVDRRGKGRPREIRGTAGNYQQKKRTRQINL